MTRVCFTVPDITIRRTVFSELLSIPMHREELPMELPPGLKMRTILISICLMQKPERTTTGDGRNSGYPTLPGIYWRFLRGNKSTSLCNPIEALE